LFEVVTEARSKQEFLLRPDLGRSLGPAACAEIQRRGLASVDVQVVIGDGLSAAAVVAQVPALLPLLHVEAIARGWTWGQPFFIRHCRVGVLNDLGVLLDPAIVILLIGERPGLATSESLSAYLAYRPRQGDDDSRRNLISNIHVRGVPADQAALRIACLAGAMMRLETSGVAVKEEWNGSSRLGE
jgi:ethanolamine ammonia-lyase small subunit